MRNEVIEAISREKIIVIVRGVAREQIIPLAEALYRGGIRLLEITYDAKGIVTDEYTAESLKMLIEHFAGRGLYFGSGTVLSEEQVELTAGAGGAFVISPDVNEAVIRKTRELGLVSIPGALTPSEATAAHRAGADFVKLFPVTSLGVGYIKEPFVIKNGYIDVPTKAGLGVELDEKALEEKIYDGKWTTPRQYFEDGSVADW